MKKKIDPARRHSATGSRKSKQAAPTCNTNTTYSSDNDRFLQNWVQARFGVPSHLATLYAEHAGLGERSK